MSRIKRIALLTDGVFPLVLGGMQKHSLYLLTYLLRSEVEVILYHPGGKGKVADHISPELVNRLTEKRMPFPKEGIMPGTYLRRSFKYSSALLQDLRKEEGIDFIYAQGFTGWALVSAKQRGDELPMVGVNLHGMEMFQKAYSFKQRVISYYFKGPARYLCKHADLVYSLGGRLTTLIKDQVPTAEVSEIPIGLAEDWAIDSVRLKRVEASERRILFIGRDEHRKGLHLLSKVLLESEFPQLEFHFVGPLDKNGFDGPNKVKMHGEIRDEGKLKEVLDTADILIVPSLSEGMPTVILEAMSRGLAIIASDVGATNELVDQQNGVLIDSNDIGAIEAALKTVGSWSTDELKMKSTSSLERFKVNFTWESVIQRTLVDLEERIRMN